MMAMSYRVPLAKRPYFSNSSPATAISKANEEVSTFRDEEGAKLFRQRIRLQWRRTRVQNLCNPEKREREKGCPYSTRRYGDRLKNEGHDDEADFASEVESSEASAYKSVYIKRAQVAICVYVDGDSKIK